MQENEWISIDDALPKLGQDVLIKSLKRWNGEYTAQLNKESFCGTDVLIFRGGIFVYMPTHWRYPVEKRPDFSKIKQGELVFIHNKNTPVIVVGFIEQISDNYLFLNMTSILSSGYYEIPKEEITKITRINLEEKTFEEI